MTTRPLSLVSVVATVALLFVIAVAIGAVNHLWVAADAPSAPTHQDLPHEEISLLAPLTALKESPYAESDLAPLRRRLTQIVASAKFAKHSVVVHDAQSGQVLFESHADLPLVPASNAKIFTAAALYDRLGPSHVQETRFRVEGELQTPTKLIVMGSGDPTVSGSFHDGDAMAAMAEVAKNLKDAGLKRVRGDLIVGPSAIVGSRRGPNWPKDAYWNWWMVDVVALPFNDNQITLKCRMNKALPTVTFDPQFPLGVIDQRLKSTTKSSRQSIMISRKDRKSEYRVRGALWSGGRGYDHDVNVADGSLYYLYALKESLKRIGVVVEGDLRRARDDENFQGASTLHVRRRSIAAAVPSMLRRSQNLYAELYFRLLGPSYGETASFEGSSRAMARWLQEREILIESTRLADGSGLSRDNQTSARQIAKVLGVMARHPDVADDFRAALAEPGRKGTLAKRMKELQGRVFAKTGTLNRISALSGYVEAGKGRQIVFSTLFNGGKVYRARSAQDRFVHELSRFSLPSRPQGD